MNIFNKILIALFLISAALFIKIVSAKKPFLERYHYSAGASSPTYFPIANTDVELITEAGEYVSASSYDTGWRFSKFSNPEEPKAVPAYLVIHYLDYRSLRVYNDSISLDKEKIRKMIKSVPRNDLFSNDKKIFFILNSWSGLRARVGYFSQWLQKARCRRLPSII